MVLRRFHSPKDPDTCALREIGDRVRSRLDSDASVYRLPVDGLEVYGVADFLNPAECARLMAIVDDVAVPSLTYDNVADGSRTSYSGDVDPHDPFIRMIQRRIDDLLGMEPRHGETMQGQRYAVGQQFRQHYDAFQPSHPFWHREQQRGGQRSWTAMAYLNAVEEGGSTDFPLADLSVPPQAGALLVWNNMRPDGKPNRKSLHAGTPVVRGTKYVMTKWYRARPWY